MYSKGRGRENKKNTELKGELKYWRRRRKTEENNVKVNVKTKSLFFYKMILADDFVLK
jgi:hypothetical protein